VSIYQNVDWIAALAMAICLVAIFAIVNVRLRLSRLKREAKQLSRDVLRLTVWAEERRLSQLDSATEKDEQTLVAVDADRHTGRRQLSASLSLDTNA
jgi:hypothetical protein